MLVAILRFAISVGIHVLATRLGQLVDSDVVFALWPASYRVDSFKSVAVLWTFVEVGPVVLVRALVVALAVRYLLAN